MLVDIESILAEYQEKERRRTAVIITPCSQPTPRSNFSLVALPNNEMLLFGGEYCDGESTVVYNDLFRWNVDRNEWKVIESLNTPPPRCSHQAVVFRDCMYIFGGEYATLDQFHHYRDMWVLDLKTNIWREIPCQGEAPSARCVCICLYMYYIPSGVGSVQDIMSGDGVLHCAITSCILPVV